MTAMIDGDDTDDDEGHNDEVCEDFLRTSHFDDDGNNPSFSSSDDKHNDGTSDGNSEDDE